MLDIVRPPSSSRINSPLLVVGEIAAAFLYQVKERVGSGKVEQGRVMAEEGIPVTFTVRLWKDGGTGRRDQDNESKQGG